MNGYDSWNIKFVIIIFTFEQKVLLLACWKKVTFDLGWRKYWLRCMVGVLLSAASQWKGQTYVNIYLDRMATKGNSLWCSGREDAIMWSTLLPMSGLMKCIGPGSIDINSENGTQCSESFRTVSNSAFVHLMHILLLIAKMPLITSTSLLLQWQA